MERSSVGIGVASLSVYLIIRSAHTAAMALGIEVEATHARRAGYHLERAHISRRRQRSGLYRVHAVQLVRARLLARPQTLGEACTVSLKLRYADFETWVRARTITATHSERELYPVVLELLRRARTRRTSIRLLGVCLSSLRPASSSWRCSKIRADAPGDGQMRERYGSSARTGQAAERERDLWPLYPFGQACSIPVSSCARVTRVTRVTEKCSTGASRRAVSFRQCPFRRERQFRLCDPNVAG